MRTTRSTRYASRVTLLSLTWTHTVELVKTGGGVAGWDGEGHEEEVVDRRMRAGWVGGGFEMCFARLLGLCRRRRRQRRPGNSNWPDPLHPTSARSPTSHSDTRSRRSSMHPFTRTTSTVDHERMRSGKPTSVLVERTPPLVLG